uniref:Uncharacterized protein n=1 Tax=uncultured bacterium esnapd22 TaxID=1366604 RepID=S5TLM0_9BACT|nr:hypothetical protein [uncultured bacterium esnapd22]
MQYLPALFVMGFYTLVVGLIVAGATMIHRLLGRVMLVLAVAVLIPLAFAPGMHVVISLLSAYAIYGGHRAILLDQRQRRVEAQAARAAAPASPPVSSAPAPAPTLPAAVNPDPRPAIPCPGCGAGTRPGGTCVYCGRHV